MVIVLSQEYYSSEGRVLITKMSKEMETILDFFRDKVQKKVYFDNIEKMTLLKFSLLGPSSEFMVYMTDLKVHINELFDDKYIVSTLFLH